MFGYYKHIRLAFLLLAVHSVTSFAVNVSPNSVRSLVELYASLLSSREALLHLEYEAKRYSGEDSQDRNAKILITSDALAKSESAYSSLHKKFETELESLQSENALPILSASYPKAQRLTSYQWQAIREFFGNTNADNFFKASYAIKEVPALSQPIAPKTKFTVIVIQDPFAKIEAQAQSAEWQALQIYYRNSSLTKEIKVLKKAGYAVLNYEASSFSGLDEQAAELKHYIAELEKNITSQVVLLSSGEASAIVHRYFDENSGLRQSQKIIAWINFNGRLHGLGLSLTKKNRHIASVSKTTCPTEYLEADAMLSLSGLQADRNLTVMPLGEGFPIYNVVRWENANRSSPELVDALVSDGKNYLVAGSRKPEDIVHIFNGLGY